MIKYILGLLFSLFVGYLCYDYGYKDATTEQYLKYRTQIESQTRQIETLQANIRLSKLEKENEIKAINTKHSAVVASLRNRTERPTTVNKTSVSGIVSTGAGSTGESLFREDAEFLIGEATKAEVIKQSLLDCRRSLLGLTK